MLPTIAELEKFGIEEYTTGWSSYEEHDVEVLFSYEDIFFVFKTSSSVMSETPIEDIIEEISLEDALLFLDNPPYECNCDE